MLIFTHLGMLLAQRLAETTAPSDPVTGLLQYGALGLVLIGFITGWIVPGWHAKALAAENTRLTTFIESKLFPMLETYATTMEKATSALDRSTDSAERGAQREQRALDLLSEREGR